MELRIPFQGVEDPIAAHTARSAAQGAGLGIGAVRDLWLAEDCRSHAGWGLPQVNGRFQSWCSEDRSILRQRHH